MDYLQHQLLQLISENGIAVKDIEEQLGRLETGSTAISRRTIQRTLNALIEMGAIEKRGQGRGVRYYPLTKTTQHKIQADKTSEGTIGQHTITLATDAQAVLPLIRAPIHQRTPVAYNIDWLREYQPNETFYLSEGTCTHLQTIGSISDPVSTYSQDIIHRVLVDLSWSSSLLEGNTYSRLDTERLITNGQAAAGKDVLETQMILNHKAALEFLLENTNTIAFTPFTVLNLHGLLSDGLMPDPAASGRLRSRPVDIGGSVYKPHAVPQVIEEAFQEILDKAEAITNPFEQAFFIMVHIPYLQPFEDVNKRTSRLGANIPLLKHNLCPLTFLDVPERSYIDAYLAIYELNRLEILRDVFVWAYERSVREYGVVRKTLTPPDPLRLKYRGELQSAVQQIVTDESSQPTSIIRAIAENLPTGCQQQFIDMVNDDVKRLHEGVLARYKVTPQEFYRWKLRQEQ